MRGDKCSICGVVEGTIRAANKSRPKIKSVAHIVRHHKKYGDDEIIVLYCQSCHRKAHIKVKQKHLCPLTYMQMDKLSHKSMKYDLQEIRFSKFFGVGIALRETLIYNKRSGSVCYYSCFERVGYSNKIPIIDIH